LIPSKPLRHIDAALIYGNQDEVGQGIKNSGVKREDIFLVSKVCTRVPESRHDIGFNTSF
jgi:diketogulonate reductase-like aldo/keto reductase